VRVNTNGRRIQSPQTCDPCGVSRVGVCSWSFQVSSIPELEELLPAVGTDLVALACGDPTHASWSEGDGLPAAALAAGFRIAGTMIGFDGEDYSSPAAFRRTGGFNDPATRPARLARLAWAVERTRELGAHDLTLHVGHVPEAGDGARGGFVDVLGQAAAVARAGDVTLCIETGPERAEVLAGCLGEIGSPSLMVNLDPANLVGSGNGDAVEAVGLLGASIRGVHIKDSLLPPGPEEWGEEVPVGRGDADVRGVLAALAGIGYAGPLVIEREVGTREQRVHDVTAAVAFVRAALDELGEG
jgi:L-ribulose-5-phosphate 3-epimerase